MSNIKTSKERIPFQQSAQQPARVGGTWEERKAYLASGGSVPQARPASPKALDQFVPKRADRSQLPIFQSNDAYRQAKMRFAGPYRPAAVDHLEKGTRPQNTSQAQPLTDNDLLRICDIVQKNQAYWDQKSVWKNTAEKDGAPKAPQANALHKGRTA